MKPIAVIPARGGSKRIPGKNIIDFCGKPMIAWTIEEAIKSNCFSRIIVSTDCHKIAAISERYGAEVPFLRTEGADDFSAVSVATLWTIEKLFDGAVEDSTNVIQLMANTPLRGYKTIVRFAEKLIELGGSSLISCFETKFGAPNWAIQMDSSTSLGRFVFNSAKTQRSQDLVRYLMPTGSIWGANFKNLKANNSFYSDNFNVFEMSWLEALDIDTPEELEICESLSKSLLSDRFGNSTSLFNCRD